MDEIDRISGWEKSLNFIYEKREKIKFFISGSNTELFTGNLASVLSGRYLTLRVYPLDYAEYRKFSPKKLGDTEAIRDFLEWGGFPRVVLESSPFLKTEILTSYLGL